MFEKKVGSDACLVLDAVSTLDTTNLIYTVVQKFNFEDVVEATKTKKVIFRVTTEDATLKGLFGDVNIADVVALDITNKRIYITGTALLGIQGTTYIAKDADTGVWTGTATVG